MTRPLNIVFDFGGVLVEWRPDQLLAAVFPDPEERRLARRDIFGHPDWAEFDRGRFSEAEIVARIAARGAFPRERLLGLFDAIRAELVPKPGTVAVLEGLAARGIPLYGLSNMSADIFRELHARHAFFGLFRGIVVSGEVGLVKPERAIYDHLARTHGLLPAECLFIDDMPANVEAARAAGFDAWQFTSAEALGAELSRRLG